MNIRINILEVASELAYRDLRKNWDYRDGEIDEDFEDEILYTEEAQDKFNDLYDKYYDLLWSLKEGSNE